MARHSHWASIKIKKGALDKKRGKIFTRHAHLIEIAARKGGDPNMNASLRIAIENARADNTPRENIDRAIKKGTGELKGVETIEVTYEGYAPGGVALMIETLTDNKNRTNQKLRTLAQKNGGTIGEAGCTSFMFEKKGVISVHPRGDKESDELEIIDAGAEDIQEGGELIIVYTGATSLGSVRKTLEAKGFRIESAELTNVAKTTVLIEDEEMARKIIAFIELLEEEEDVSSVAANFEFPENLAL